MTASVFADSLGPRGRRRVFIASIASTAVLAAALWVSVQRLAANDQLDAEKWTGLFQPAVLRFFWGGLRATVSAALTAMVLAMLLGGLLALGRLSRTAAVRWLTGAYIEFFRGVPVLLLILFSALALPKYGLDFSRFWYLVLALVAYNSAVLGEIFRAGILSLDRGQTEAAHALGLGYWQTMFLVVIPQAVRRMVPAIVSQLVTLLKDTALGFVIAYEELLRRGQQAGEFFKNPLQALTFVAVIYIAVNFTLGRVARWLEVRQRRRYGAGGIQVAGTEDLAVVVAEAESRL